MSLAALTVPAFGGLKLNVDAEEGQAALDLMNVDLGTPGSLRTRMGSANFTPADVAANYRAVAPFYRVASAQQLLALRAAGGGRFGTAARIGTSGTEYLYLAAGSGTWEAYSNTPALVTSAAAGATQITRWDGAAFSSPAGLAGIGPPEHLAVQSPDNRLVGGNLTADGFPSRVRFSGAGTPETWGADDWVDLTPGDGEEVTALVAWRELLFAFKRTKFFVFTGNDIDATGGVIFDYRPVDVGVGCDIEYSATAADDGVYFADRTGIYRTTGDAPVRVSRDIDPFFDRTDPDTFLGPTFSAFTGALEVLDGNIYVGVKTSESFGNPSHTLVYDNRTQTWSLWDIAPNAFARYSIGAAGNDQLLVAPYDVVRVRRMAPDLTTDAGSAISWRYQSAYNDFGGPNEKFPTRVELTGEGTVTFEWAVKGKRGGHVVPSSSSIVIPEDGVGYYTKAASGRKFSYKLSGSGSARVDSLTIRAQTAPV